MALRWTSAIVLSWGLLVVGSIVAQDGSTEGSEPASRTVVVDSDQCDVVQRDELRKLIALELAPRTVRSTDPVHDGPAPTHARVACSDTQARLVVEDVARGRRQELTLDLTEVAVPARPRLLALSLSELIATVEMEPTPRAHVEAPRGEHASVQPAQNPPARSSRAWLGAGIAREGRPVMLQPSLQTGITAAFTRWPLALQGELQLHRGKRSVSAGDVVSWTVSGSAGVGGQLVNAWAELTLGLGLRLGYARLHGDVGGSYDGGSGAPVTGHTVSGLWWGPTTFVGAVLPTHARWGVRCGLDLSWVARDVRGLDSAGSVSYSVGGLQLHANIGVSLKLAEKRKTNE
jgi:hypothetical protein